MNKKIIVVDADRNYEDGAFPVVKVFDNVDDSFIQELVGELSNLDTLKAIFENPVLAQHISDMGYVNVKEIKDLKEKVKLEQKYYMTHDGWGPTAVNLNKLTRGQAQDLASEGACLLQQVDIDATLKNWPTAHLAYRKEKIAVQKKIKNREEAKQKRAEKLLEKKVAKAKQLLATVEGDPWVEGIMNR